MLDNTIMLGIIMGVSQVVKMATPKIDNKYTPILNIALGVIICVLYNDGIIRNDVLQGLLMGLTASGLYDSTVNVFKK